MDTPFTSSVIVCVIDIDRMAIFESEGHAPVPRHGDGVVPPEFTRQRMQSEPWHVHALGYPASLEHGRDTPQPPNVLRGHPPRTAASVERSEATVLER